MRFLPERLFIFSKLLTNCSVWCTKIDLNWVILIACNRDVSNNMLTGYLPPDLNPKNFRYISSVLILFRNEYQSHVYL